MGLTSEIAGRRHLPENLAVGDQIRTNVVLDGQIVTKELADSGDWLVTVVIKGLATESLQTAKEGQSGQPGKRMRSVMWSATESGDLEVVLDLGARQRIVTVGLSAKQRSSLRENLGALSTREAEALLQEIVSDANAGGGATGQLANGNENQGRSEGQI